MTYASAFVLLFIVATVVSLAARRLHVPYTVALVVAGLAIGATHALPVPPLTRELLFAVFLPGLLFEAAFHLDVEELRRDGVTLASLAVPGVVVAIALIAPTLGPAMRLFGVPDALGPGWHAALLFAALISATDPVAVVALFRALDAPRRLQVLVEGESLLNDGTAIIFFTLALTATDGSLVSATLVTDFLYVVGAGIIVGGAIGALAAQAIQRVTEPTLEVMLTTIAAYGSFLAGEGVHASGVIATVTAGVLCGSRGTRRGMSTGARIATATFWEYVAFALNSAVFLLIGLIVRVPTLVREWRAILAAYLVVTTSRIVVTTGLAALLPREMRIPARWTAILAWGGLRGGLSMVLALSLPASLPQRDRLVTITFGVVILSILAQGVTIGPALRWLGLTRPDRPRVDYDQTRDALLAAHAALDDLDRLAILATGDAALRSALADEYEQRIRHAERALRALTEQAGGARHLLVDTERRRVDDAFHAGALTGEMRERLLRELDALWLDAGRPPETR